MKSTQPSVLAGTVVMVLSVLSLSTLPAYAADSTAPASDATMSKQDLKAQKKAERQARRAKKNAELSKLEKNGYSPAGEQTNYPQNLQDAQRKAAGQKPTNASGAP